VDFSSHGGLPFFGKTSSLGMLPCCSMDTLPNTLPGFSHSGGENDLKESLLLSVLVIRTLGGRLQKVSPGLCEKKRALLPQFSWPLPGSVVSLLLLSERLCFSEII